MPALAGCQHHPMSLCCPGEQGPGSALWPSPHHEVVPIDFGAVAGAAQVAGVANHGAAAAAARVTGAVRILARHDLEELAQDLVGVVGLELGLQHLQGGKEGRGQSASAPSLVEEKSVPPEPEHAVALPSPCSPSTTSGRRAVGPCSPWSTLGTRCRHSAHQTSRWLRAPRPGSGGRSSPEGTAPLC